MTGVLSQAKRRAILDAATEAFLHSGYAASVDDIAAAAGVGKQTVYRHFGDKESLFLAAVSDARSGRAAGGASSPSPSGLGTPDWSFPAARREPSPEPEGTLSDGVVPDSAVPDSGVSGGAGPDGTLSDTGDPLADLTAIGERVLEATLSPTVAALHRLTIAEIGNHPELSHHWGDGAAPFVYDALAGYLRRADQAGRLDVPDAGRAARQFAYLLVTEGRVASAYGTRPLSREERHRLAAETADLIVRAHRPA